MTRSEARDYIINHTDEVLEKFLTRDKNDSFCCPVCGDGRGKHGTGLFREKWKDEAKTIKDGLHFTCIRDKCFNHKDVFDLIGIYYGYSSYNDEIKKAAEFMTIELIPDPPGAARKQSINSRSEDEVRKKSDFCDPIKKETPAADQSEKPPKDYTKKAYNYWHSCIDQTDYWRKRGFTRETMSRFKVGYNPEFTIYKDGKPAGAWKALIIPITKYSFAVRNTDPAADHGDRHRKVGKGTEFYNPLKIDFTTLDRPVFIVEGELDALSIIQAGGNAIAARSTDNIPALIEWLKERQPQQPRGIFGLLDNDEAGRTATKALEQGLKDTFFLFEGFFPPRDKDVNDTLKESPGELAKFLDRFNQNYERYTEILRNGT